MIGKVVGKPIRPDFANPQRGEVTNGTVSAGN